MRLNNTDLKTLRVRSLDTFIDNYLTLYNTNADSNEANKANRVNTSFNFYLMNLNDLKSVPSGVESASVIVKSGKIAAIDYFTAGKAKQRVSNESTLSKMITLTQPVDIKMVKVHSILDGKTYDATTALSVKRSPVASPVSNKLDTITVPFGTKGSDTAFTNNINIRDSLGNRIDLSAITMSLKDSDNNDVSMDEALTKPRYQMTYTAVDSVSNSKLKVVREVLVDQNMPLIVTPDVYTDYVGAKALVGVSAYEMPKGASGKRGTDITSNVTQNLKDSDLLKSGTYDQVLEVKSPSNGQVTKKSRKLVLLENTPSITTPNLVIGTYSTGFMPTPTELYAGVVATSPRDGDITTAINLDTTKVDSTKPGTYNVVYTVTAPTGGVTATLTRTIIFK